MLFAVFFVDYARDAAVLVEKIDKRCAEQELRARLLCPAVQARDVARHMHADRGTEVLFRVAPKSGVGQPASELKRKVVVFLRQGNSKAVKIRLADMEDIQPLAERVLIQLVEHEHAVPRLGDSARKKTARCRRPNDDNIKLLHNTLRCYSITWKMCWKLLLAISVYHKKNPAIIS
ncbi:hypothetical protein SDC9_73452 [bioreactor metagenome]|uniref:Uncharacterized protein n=1 Tax=bioreactor metagenome TaxID=1076179 RepID=A0A644YFC3_9ZZZZ